MRDDDNDAGGHYVTTGTTLVALGSVAIVVATVLALVLHVDLRFIDAQTMAAIGVGFGVVGGWMLIHGRRLALEAGEERG